jgi:TPR repeat protein
MRVPSVIVLLTALILPTVAFAEIKTFTATHTYVLGDHDSKDDARQRCLLETKRKILEQAGVYIESASEVKDLQLTKDKITSFAAAVMQVRDTKEKVGFENGHMTLTLTTTAQVDLEEVRKQLDARQVDAGVREDVAVQKESLKRLEAQLEAMQREMQLAPGRTPSPPTSEISAADVQTLRTRAAQGNAGGQVRLGLLYAEGRGVPKDYVQARQWYEKAAAQGDAMGQFALGLVYAEGRGATKDYVQAAQWYEKAAAQGNTGAQLQLGMLYAEGRGVPQDYVRAYKWFYLVATNSTGEIQEGAAYNRDKIARRMTSVQVAEAEKLAIRCQAEQFKGC